MVHIIVCSNKGLKDSTLAYIKNEWQTDYPCAQVLSEWPYIDGQTNQICGRCPSIDCIPAFDHDIFRSFTIHLFNALPGFSHEFYEILTCNLMFWYEEMSLVIMKKLNNGYVLLKNNLQSRMDYIFQFHLFILNLQLKCYHHKLVN